MFVNSPEKVIISDDPAHEEGEEGHEEELGDKANQGSHWLFEHLDKALYDNTKYNYNTTINNNNNNNNNINSTQQQASWTPWPWFAQQYNLQ